ISAKPRGRISHIFHLGFHPKLSPPWSARPCGRRLCPRGATGAEAACRKKLLVSFPIFVGPDEGDGPKRAVDAAAYAEADGGRGGNGLRHEMCWSPHCPILLTQCATQVCRQRLKVKMKLPANICRDGAYR